ncbi:hypothetical protein ABET11_13020 [Priestia megaterium]|uniref:hypothetical protein n=1 Tax=Priestia megaterium TaxID=1404 RepID=UPI000BF4E8BD|nr:hypothetical protein [Priestia megaterium]MED4615685.1 hypothetical protein [Priestia megaterium]PEW20904.1 hypothetical protein CN435_12765 [Priestia megaterium]PEZ47855.1 hypothetical protein CN367_08775 [Priestia megaterium]PFL67916.1 hypothetical protein COJ36_11585 [Priestia megaterium]QCR27418.1 hypothetical protein C1N54_11395 [Priestia megaterium]
MPYEQKDYYISAKDNEYYKALNVVEHLAEEDKQRNNSPMWTETLEKLTNELKDNNGDNLTPWHFNMIISILLDYVPTEVKDK